MSFDTMGRSVSLRYSARLIPLNAAAIRASATTPASIFTDTSFRLVIVEAVRAVIAVSATRATCSLRQTSESTQSVTWVACRSSAYNYARWLLTPGGIFLTIPTSGLSDWLQQQEKRDGEHQGSADR